MKKYALSPLGAISLAGAGIGGLIGGGLGLYGHYMHNISTKRRDVALKDSTTRFLARHSLATTLGSQFLAGATGILPGMLSSGGGYIASALNRRHPARAAAITGAAIGAAPGLVGALLF